MRKHTRSTETMQATTHLKQRRDATTHLTERDDAKQYDTIMENPIEGLTVKNLEVDLKIIQSDEGKTERNKKWIEGLEKDVYIQEALLIMKDMMK